MATRYKVDRLWKDHDTWEPEPLDGYPYRVVLAADHERELAEAHENAPWLTVAHTLCAEAGIPVGHIHARLMAVRIVLTGRDQRIAELERDLRWACDQLIYYLPKPMDTEASRVFDRARAILEMEKRK